MSVHGDEEPQPPSLDPSEPSIPISYPITSLDDLESRSYFNSFHYPFNKASIPLAAASTLPSRPRLLVCHDMAGGYGDDRWVQGGSSAEAYAIWHWYLMDVFVYFSHSLVTLPPPCWINAAHTHGVKVLGTFILEWDEGRSISKILLSTKESARMYAERLSELAAALGFDGWLINMEVKLDIDHIDTLKEFISHLTQMMHSSTPGSLVIWYDSVTVDGKLEWQDQLNVKNKPFFDLCDGIFVNYTWKEDYPKISAAFAGERRHDVYMGIDVFGRNTYGGGEWNTNVALDLLRVDDVSAAIFAPGWVYETKQPPDFQTAQNRWWGLVEKSWGILQSYPKSLPFSSNFDQGHGYHFSIEGLQVASDPWNNISSQGFQPMLDSCLESTNEATLKVFNKSFKETSYDGGGNITIDGDLKYNASFSTRLFQGQLSLEAAPLYISYSVRMEGNSILGLSFGFSSDAGEKVFILVSNYKPTMLTDPSMSKYEEIIVPQAKKVVASPLDRAWIVYETFIKRPHHKLTYVGVVCYLAANPEIDMEAPYHASLGQINLRASAENTVFPPADSWVLECKNISWALSSSQSKGIVSLQIIWELQKDFTMTFQRYNIYVKKHSNKKIKLDGSGNTAASQQYLGVAKVETFYVSNLECASDVSSLEFIVQVCALDGSCQELSDSPACMLPVTVQ